MDLCIKTNNNKYTEVYNDSFNPCFNGSMYKNVNTDDIYIYSIQCFNPCFNGSMYKNT